MARRFQVTSKAPDDRGDINDTVTVNVICLIKYNLLSSNPFATSIVKDAPWSRLGDRPCIHNHRMDTLGSLVKRAEYDRRDRGECDEATSILRAEPEDIVRAAGRNEATRADNLGDR